jgi:starch synthase
VRRTGGLADTVFDVDHDAQRARAAGHDGTNGYAFDGTDAPALEYGLDRAIAAYYGDRAAWEALRGRCMASDWSWYGPALDYITLYWKAAGGR